MLPWILCIILLIILLLLTVKIALLHRAMDEICKEFQAHLSADTNTLISVSSNDPHIKKLAAEINVQLRLLRQERRHYQQGDQGVRDTVTNISHDLRTPLTAICGYLDLLQQEDKSETVHRYLTIIKGRVDALKQLAEELFRYSVILAEQQELPLSPLSLNSALEESILAYYGALKEKGITPEITMPEEPVWSHLNKNALSRIIGNILSNAIKYSDGNLRITLTNSGELLFENHAPGLDEGKVGRLFDRYYTVETASNSTGLGLSIAKILTERMQGTISATYDAEDLCIRLKF